MAELKRLNNELSVPVIDETGAVAAKPLRLVNVPMVELWPEEKVVIVDWLASNDQRPTADELGIPVLYNGVHYLGCVAWGSAVKRCQTIGLTRDLLVEDGPLTEVERTIKSGRMLLSQGLYGGLVGDLHVQVMNPGRYKGGKWIKGDRIGDNVVADGGGMIRRSTAEHGRSGQEPINLGAGKQGYQFWQRVPWTKPVAKELTPLITNLLQDIAEGTGWAMEHKDSTWSYRQELCELEPKLLEHPYVANALSRSSAEDYFRAATTVPVPCDVRVAVATEAVEKAAVVGKYIVPRYPIQADSSMPAVKANEKAEAARIAELEVVQYTIASKDVMINGTLIVVDDEDMPEGVDIVVSSQDIKMGSRRLGRRTIHGVINFTQWWAAGSAIGLNPRWAKLSGADFDGDLIFVYNCKKFPQLYKAVATLGGAPTSKLNKSHTRIAKEDARAEMAANSMCNIVGFATNIMSATFAIADRAWLAAKLGFADLQTMDYRLDRLIKIGTDGMKTREWVRDRVEKDLVFLQKNIQTTLARIAPWTKWKRSTWAFRRGIPGLWHKGMEEVADANAVPVHFNGTIGQICKLTLPSLEAALKTPILQKPLSGFRNWAPTVAGRVQLEAHALQMHYNGRVRGVNWTDPKDALRFRVEWQRDLADWIRKSGISRQIACFAMWREAHDTRSDEASGASVFIGFPELVKKIVVEKPGLKVNQVPTLLVGLGYVMDEVPEPLICEIEVMDFVQIKRGKRIVRKIVCAYDLENKRAPAAPYPLDMLGMVDLHSRQPESGKYQARIHKGRGNSWNCDLVTL